MSGYLSRAVNAIKTITSNAANKIKALLPNVPEPIKNTFSRLLNRQQAITREVNNISQTPTISHSTLPQVQTSLNGVKTIYNFQGMNNVGIRDYFNNNRDYLINSIRSKLARNPSLKLNLAINVDYWSSREQKNFDKYFKSDTVEFHQGSNIEERVEDLLFNVSDKIGNMVQDSELVVHGVSSMSCTAWGYNPAGRGYIETPKILEYSTCNYKNDDDKCFLNACVVAMNYHKYKEQANIQAENQITNQPLKVMTNN
jgi:hypothetical protein